MPENFTPKQNKDYILKNLNKFILDNRGNFFDVENDDYIGQSNVSDYDEIRTKMAQMIIENKTNWEIVKDTSNYREISSGRVMFGEGFGFDLQNKIEIGLGRQKKRCSKCRKETTLLLTTRSKAGLCQVCDTDELLNRSEESRKERRECERLKNLLKNSKSLTKLEANYQTVKNSTLYNSGKKVPWTDGENYEQHLDWHYRSYKKSLEHKNAKWTCPKCGYDNYSSRECIGGCWDERNKQQEKELTEIKKRGKDYWEFWQLLRDSKTLTELENNYQKIKNNPSYNLIGRDYQNWLDIDYNAFKIHLECDSLLQPKERKEVPNNSNPLTLEQIKDIFQTRKIKSIERKDEKIEIVYRLSKEYNDKGDQSTIIKTYAEDDPEIQDLSQYLQDNHQTLLTQEELFGTSHNTNLSSNKEPQDNSIQWKVVLAIFGWLVIIVVIILLLCSTTKKKHRSLTKR